MLLFNPVEGTMGSFVVGSRGQNHARISSRATLGQLGPISSMLKVSRLGITKNPVVPTLVYGLHTGDYGLPTGNARVGETRVSSRRVEISGSDWVCFGMYTPNFGLWPGMFRVQVGYRSSYRAPNCFKAAKTCSKVILMLNKTGRTRPGPQGSL